MEGNFEQFRDYGQNKKDRLCNKFLAKKLDEKNDSLVFQIDSLVKTTKNIERKIFKPVEELKFMTSKNDRRQTIQDTFQSKLNTLTSKTVEEEKMEEDLDFFLRNNVNQKKIVEKKKYTT